MSTLRTNVYAALIIAAIIALAAIIASMRASGARDAEVEQLEEQWHRAAALAGQEARGRAAAVAALEATRDTLQDARRIAAADSARADEMEARYWAARAATAAGAVAVPGLPTFPAERPPLSDAEQLALADAALRTCSLARRSCAEESRLARATIALQDSIIASQAREIEHRKAIAAALERMRPTFSDAAREVGTEALCGGAGAGGGLLVARTVLDAGAAVDDVWRDLLGAAGGAVVGVVGCAIAVR